MERAGSTGEGMLLFCLGRTGKPCSRGREQVEQSCWELTQGNTWCVQGIGRKSVWFNKSELNRECRRGVLRGRG